MFKYLLSIGIWECNRTQDRPPAPTQACKGAGHSLGEWGEKSCIETNKGSETNKGTPLCTCRLCLPLRHWHLVQIGLPVLKSVNLSV